MEIIDRVSTYPGRVKLTPVGGGEPVLYDMEWADQPASAGTPISRSGIGKVIGQAETLAFSSARNSAEMILQKYYDGENVNWKNRLFFDGFRNGSYIFSMTSGVVRGTNVLSISKTGQYDIDLGTTDKNNSTANRPKTNTCTASGNGSITGFRFYTTLVGVSAGNFTVTWSVFVNGVKVRSSNAGLYCPIAKTEQSINIGSVIVSYGDEFYIQLSSNTGGLFSYTGTNGGQGGVIEITPYSAESGSVTSTSQSISNCGLLRGWVRYNGGSVGLSVISGDDELEFDELGTKNTINTDGDSCQETEFRLADGFPETGNVKFKLNLELGADNNMKVFDYGVFWA